MARVARSSSSLSDMWQKQPAGHGLAFAGLGLRARWVGANKQCRYGHCPAGGETRGGGRFQTEWREGAEGPAGPEEKWQRLRA